MATTRTPWDRLAEKVKRARRAEQQSDVGGWRACARIKELQTILAAVEREVDHEVIRAREQGMTWENLGGTLDITKQGAQHRYRIAMTRTGRAGDYDFLGVARTMRELEVKQD